MGVKLLNISLKYVSEDKKPPYKPPFLISCMREFKDDNEIFRKYLRIAEKLMEEHDNISKREENNNERQTRIESLRTSILEMMNGNKNVLSVDGFSTDKQLSINKFFNSEKERAAFKMFYRAHPTCLPHRSSNLIP